MLDKKIILFTLLTVVTTDREDDGQYNYLLSAKNGAEYAISYSSPKFLPFKEGESFSGHVEADCEQDYSVDETASDRLNQWITYRSYICNATELDYDLP